MISESASFMSTYCGVNTCLAKWLDIVLNVKALVGTFNQEKALVWAFFVIVETYCETDGSFYSTDLNTDHSSRQEYSDTTTAGTGDMGPATQLTLQGLLF